MMEGGLHAILRIGIIRALNESVGRLFRAATYIPLIPNQWTYMINRNSLLKIV